MNAEITSANICGYQNVDLPGASQYALLTPTFKTLDAQPLDLKSIKMYKKGAASFTSLNKVTIQKINQETGVLSAIFSYTTQGGGKWRNYNEGRDATDGECVLSYGEAFYLFNGGVDGLYFQFSGEVELNPVTAVTIPASQVGLIGNCTPSSVDLKSCYPTVNGVKISGTSLNKITVQKIDMQTGVLGTIFSYTTQGGGKWRNYNEGRDATDGECVLDPGQSLYVINGTPAAEIGLHFPSPVNE